MAQNKGASAKPTGLGAPKGAEPHSRLMASPAIPSAWQAFKALSMPEQNAFLAFFAAPWCDIKIFVSADGKVYPPSFGKAECEWVPFRETWQHKFPQLGLTTFEESEPKPALGMADGATWTEAQIRVTAEGSAVRERFYAEVASAIEARSGETVQLGSTEGESAVGATSAETPALSSPRRG